MSEIIKLIQPQIQYLDWKENTLYVFEKRKNIILVNALVKAIEAGEFIDPVPLQNPNKGVYLLAKGFDLTNENIGGHHRAIAHYITDTPLPYFQVSFDRIFSEHMPWIKIGEMQLYHHNELKDGCFCKRRKQAREDFLSRLKKYPRLDIRDY